MTTMHGIPFEKFDSIRLGLIGAGERGRYLLHELLACEGVEVKAIADVSEASSLKAVDSITQAGRPAVARGGP